VQESKEAVPQGCIRDNTTGQEVPANAPPAQAIQVHKGIFFLSRKIGKKFFSLLTKQGGGVVVAYLTFFKYFFRQTLSTVIQLLNNMSSNLFAVDLVLRNQFLCVVHRRDVLPSDRHISMTNFLRYVY
jgi:hypothetical protein